MSVIAIVDYGVGNLFSLKSSFAAIGAEALILSAADLSGRSFLVYELQIPTEKIGTFDTQLTEEFFTAFVSNAGITLHLRQLSGKNSHHIVEGAFKSVARSLRKAVAIDPDFSGEVPSTKGVLA